MSRQHGVGSRSSQARARIVRAAGAIMLEHGYAAVSYRSIARQVDVTPGLVQYYFPDLDELFIAVLTAWTDGAVERLASAGQSARPLRAVWEYAGDKAGIALLLEFMALANHRKAIAPVLGEGGERVRQTLLAALNAAARHYRSAGTEIPAAAMVFLMSAIPRMIRLEETFGTTTGHAETIQLVEAFLDEVEPLPTDDIEPDREPRARRPRP